MTSLTDSLTNVLKFQNTSRSTGNMKMWLHLGIGVESREKLIIPIFGPQSIGKKLLNIRAILSLANY